MGVQAFVAFVAAVAFGSYLSGGVDAGVVGFWLAILGGLFIDRALTSARS